MNLPVPTSARVPFRRTRWWIGAALAAVAMLPVAPPAARADEVTRRLQEELRRRNLYFGDVDGRASAQLAAALHRYQDRKGFSSTGQADADTLLSLNIPPARPVAAAAPDAAIPPALGPRPAEAFVAIWPDVTVLRSDEARPTPAPGDDADAAIARAEAALAGGPAVVAATPTPAPPPASAGTRRRPTVEEVRDFVTQYLEAGQNNDDAAELRFYGEPIAFYDEGTVDHTYVARAVARYDHRWPERHFVVLGPVTVADSPDGSPTKFVVNFRLGFNVKGPRYAVAGKTDNTWTVSGPAPDGWKIVSMREQRVREK